LIQMSRIYIFINTIYSRKFVVKHDFINECFLMGMEFSEEEFEKIFEFITQIGTTGT
jgi:hypothetical protein